MWGPGMPGEQWWAVPIRQGALGSAQGTWAEVSVGRTLGSRAQGRGSGVPIGAGWEAQAVPTAALESPAWLCQPPGSNRVKWRP